MSAQHSPSSAGTAAPSLSNLSLGAAEQRAAKGKSPERNQPQHVGQAPIDADMSCLDSDSSQMRNRASKSNSPYIHSQTSSPVHWQLLDHEAVSRARRENKLIFLNVGFRACHCMPAPVIRTLFLSDD